LDMENRKREAETVELAMELAPDTETETSNQRDFKGVFGKILVGYAALVAVFHIYFLIGTPMEQLTFRSYHLLLLGILGFAFFPGWQKAKSKIHWSDYLGMAMLTGITLYMIYHLNRIQFIFGTNRPTDLDTLVALAGIVIVLELARRTSGNSLPILCLIFIAYPFVGPYLPGIFNTPVYTPTRVFTYLFSGSGVFGVPIGISAKYIILFIIFSSFLTVSGVGTYFVKFAFALSGSVRGGPAKVAVFSSALMGMINGTSAGNVVATGSLSIPLMKRVGYSPTFAAAIEAVASTGGQIMPPVMGAGVFIMADVIGMRYERIMLAAIIPALLYFSSCYMMVDYEAIKKNLRGVPRHLLPSIVQTLKHAYLFIPVIVLISSMIAGHSIIKAGYWGILSSFLVSWLKPVFYLLSKNSGKEPENTATAVKTERHGALDILVNGAHGSMGLSQVVEALEKGARNSVQLMSVCAAAGIIMGVIMMTGVGSRFANVLLGIADTNVLLALIFTMFICMLLGMGMPTTAAYAVAASVMGPGLIQVTMNNPAFAHVPADLIRLLPHMFIFYFACLSAITPPVALAAYAGAGISGSDPMKASFMSFRLGIASYIIPYMFFFSPEILGIGSPLMVALRTIAAIIGIISLASAVQGYFRKNLNMLQRLIMLIASISLISPSEFANLLGIALIVFIYFSHDLPFLKSASVQSGSQK